MATTKWVVSGDLGPVLGVKAGVPVTDAELARKIKRQTKAAGAKVLISFGLAKALGKKAGAVSKATLDRAVKRHLKPMIEVGQKWLYVADGYPRGQWLRVLAMGPSGVRFQWYGKGAPSTMTAAHLFDHGRLA